METPLYATEQEALNAPGEVYRHYKGGIYRLIQRDVIHTETQEKGVFYEHIWPHDHGYYFRPQEMFFGKNADGEERFRLIERA